MFTMSSLKKLGAKIKTTVNNVKEKVLKNDDEREEVE